MKALQNIDNNKASAKRKKIELSTREIEVLDLLTKGLTNKDIASRLFISPFTVKRHTENIYRKLNVSNRICLLQKAHQQKLL